MKTRTENGRKLRQRILSGGLVAVLLLFTLTGCAKPVLQAEGGEQARVKIGIMQIVEHPALDMARTGFLDLLKEHGWEDKITVDIQSAQGDIATAHTIARKFVSDKVDLILAIATPTAQAAANATSDIPILITAVTDPVAAGLVNSLEHPGGNVSGTTDMNPVPEQLELLLKLVPNAKRIGIPYNAGETNSLVQVERARKAAVRLGIELVEVTVTSTNEVAQAAQSLVGKVDALYIPSDNTIVSAIASVIQVAEQAKLPIVSAGRDVVSVGGIATLGIDYYKLGRQTGKIALKVFAGEDPGSLPIQGQNEFKLVINRTAAKAIGLEIPAELLLEAEVID